MERGEIMATDTYSNVESQVYSYVVNTIGYNTAIACGILANVEAESNFNPEAVGDGGDAYGLFQWNDRRSKLFSHTGTTKPSVSQQLSFVKYELNSTETRARNAIEKLPNTAQGAYDAADIFCRLFERPRNSTSEGARRGGIARDKYWSKYANGTPSTGVSFVSNLGQRIVQIAKSLVGSPYVQGGNMYDNDKQGADGPGLVYYCYKEAGVDIPESTIVGYHKSYESTAKRINDVSDVCAADLLFYLDDNVGLGDIAIANGDGGMIYVSNSLGVTEVDSIGSPADILRILSDAETSQGYVPSSEESAGSATGTNAIDYIALTSYDPYALSIKNNLSRIETAGYDYGYLIDLTHGGGFRFYVPEFTEQAGANWSNIDIRGRSVGVKAYDSTDSRTITVSLDLYAGAGLYEATPGESGEETVSRLHRDAYFVKSLEYPDYSNAITRPPSTVHLILGSAVNIIGVVSSVIIEHMKPVDSQNRAMYLKMTFTVTQTAVNPPDYADIRRGQYAIIGTADRDSLDIESPFQDATNAPIYTEEDER